MNAAFSIKFILLLPINEYLKQKISSVQDPAYLRRTFPVSFYFKLSRSRHNPLTVYKLNVEY